MTGARRGADPAVLGAVAALAAHDLRNLLAVAESSAALARENPDDRTFAERHLAKVSEKVRAAQELLGRCMAVASGEPVEKRAVEMSSIVRNALADVVAPDTVEIRTSGETEILHAEPALLAAAVGNLVRNAVEAIRGARGAGMIAIEVERADGGAVLRVCDDGPGLSPDVAFGNVTTKPGGSGVGLLAARAIAEAHGGSLALAAREGWATCLELHLPDE